MSHDMERFNSDQIEVWVNQLYEPKIQFLKIKILLSSLREIVDSDKTIRPDTAMKIKKVILFGDLNDYLEIQLPSNVPLISETKTILGIPKELATRNVSLTDKERLTVLEAVTQNLHNKNKSIMEIFEITKPNAPRSELLKKMKELPSHLNVFTNMQSSADVAINMNKQIQNLLEECYEELRKMYELLEGLVKIRLNVISPQYVSMVNENHLRHRTVLEGSKVFCLTMQKEIYTPETIKALKIINDKQKEEREEKETELHALKQELALYEKLLPEGFDELLKEYMEIEKKLESQRRTFKDMFNRSFTSSYVDQNNS